MDWKNKITRTLRSATSDKTGMDQKFLKWHKSFKEVEKIVNQGKK